MLCKLREFLQWREGDAIILAEANVLPETDMEYFGEDGDRMHMMLSLGDRNLFCALAVGDYRPLVKGTGNNPDAAGHGSMELVPAQP